MTQLLIPKELDAYCERFSTAETDVLAALNRETNMKVQMPVMLSGHLQGSILQMISYMLRPERVLEIGTFTGYSAICLAMGLPENGVLDTIDVNEELQEMAFGYFCKSGVEKKIRQHIGNAAAIIPELEGPYDLVFIDADKQNYHLYFDQVIDKVRMGGFILADNVLFDGEVVMEEEQQSKNGKAIHAFNIKVNNDPRVEQVVVPVRDGITIMRKIAE